MNKKQDNKGKQSFPLVLPNKSAISVDLELFNAIASAYGKKNSIHNIISSAIMNLNNLLNADLPEDFRKVEYIRHIQDEYLMLQFDGYVKQLAKETAAANELVAEAPDSESGIH